MHPMHIILPIAGTILGYVIGVVPAVIAGITFGLIYRPGWRTSDLKRALAGAMCGLFSCILCGYVVYKFDIPYPMFDRTSLDGVRDTIRFYAMFGLLAGTVCGYFFPRRISERLSERPVLLEPSHRDINPEHRDDRT